MTLQAGDVIALSGPRQVIVDVVGPRGEEVEDKDLLDVPITTADVLLTNPKLAGRNLGDDRGRIGRGACILRPLSRGGQEIPIAPASCCSVAICCICRPGGRRAEGGSEDRRHRRSQRTIDFVVLGLAIFLGGVVGVLLTFRSASKSR